MNKRHFESEARFLGFSKIAGVDEAGRGPLAGPLVVAACILPEEILPIEIDDSKKLTKEQREAAYEQLTRDAIAFSIITLSVELIDQMNIFQATMHGMQKAVKELTVTPDFVLVDGNHAPRLPMRARAIVQGDALSDSIGAASILAKVARDRLMVALHHQWPEYGFDEHKGYATPRHLEILSKLGPCPAHRKSYAPVREALLSKAGRWVQEEFVL